MPLRRVRVERIVLGFVFAPLIIPALLTGMRPFITGSEMGPAGFQDLGSGFFMLVILAYIGALALGIPAFVLLRKLNANSIVWYCLAGAAVVFCFTAGISLITGGIQHGQHTSFALTRTLIFTLVGGGLAGGLFRLIAVPS